MRREGIKTHIRVSRIPQYLTPSPLEIVLHSIQEDLKKVLEVHLKNLNVCCEWQKRKNLKNWKKKMFNQDEGKI